MFNPLQSTTIGALEKTLAFTERRHKVLAGNLANISTPDYRSRDLDVDAFQTALAESIQSRQGRSSAVTANETLASNRSNPPSPLAMFRQFVSEHPAASADTDAMLGDPEISGLDATGSATYTMLDDHDQTSTRDDRISGPRSPMEGIVYHDESDVSMEQEVTRIAKNRHLHNVAIATMRNQFDLMRAAITERA
ncbi:MAG: flagellar biosynthesis protein FlgB [Planctomycetota bacterium]